jgi:hypothetical protein
MVGAVGMMPEAAALYVGLIVCILLLSKHRPLDTNFAIRQKNRAELASRPASSLIECPKAYFVLIVVSRATGTRPIITLDV